MKHKIAVFPGTFDPITVGHESIVHRAVTLFDKIYIAIGCNAEKRTLFQIDDRIKFIESTFKGMEKIEVTTYKGLTIDFCKSVNATFMIRGIRNGMDFEFEKNIAQINKKISSIDTLFLISSPEGSPVSSSIVRDIFTHGGDISEFIPQAIIQMINQR